MWLRHRRIVRARATSNTFVTGAGGGVEQDSGCEAGLAGQTSVRPAYLDAFWEARPGPNEHTGDRRGSGDDPGWVAEVEKTESEPL